MNPIQKAAKDWESNAIEKCRQDPAMAAMEAAGELCIRCDMSHPCLCDRQATLTKMRTFYEQNRRIEKTSWTGKTSIIRAEPVLKMNWGQKGDGLMDSLYRIASEPFRVEIKRLLGPSRRK